MEPLVEASKRSPRNEVARFILSDLDSAIEMMSSGKGTEKTRINRECALLMKSRVALFEGTLAEILQRYSFRSQRTGMAGKE